MSSFPYTIQPVSALNFSRQPLPYVQWMHIGEGSIRVHAGDELTPRQMTVLSLMALGHDDPAIAQMLYLSPNTVHTHRTNGFRKLGAVSMGHAVRRLFEDEVYVVDHPIANLKLSPRRTEILGLIADGLSEPTIAAELGIAHSTVNTHMDTLRWRLGAPNQARAVLMGYLIDALPAVSSKDEN